MSKLKEILRARVDDRVRDSFYVLRTRRDPTLFSSLVRTRLGIRRQALDNALHLDATMTWLASAQDATPDGGISAFYDVRAGSWGPSYPETSGYIISTFLQYARLFHADAYWARTLRAAGWLLTLQFADGSFPIGPLWPHWKREPIVFDTGQIMHGLVSLFEETLEPGYLQSARRAADWLISIQSEDGSWRQFTSQGYVHTYNVRVAWALLRLSNACGDEAYRTAARRNLTWALTQQTRSGWFHNAAFAPGDAPLTHTIAYTIRGMLESGILLDDRALVDAAIVAADALKERQKQDGQLFARYAADWRIADHSSCLTGNAQLAIIWLRLYERTCSMDYLHAADTAIDFIKKTQACHAKHVGVSGGIAGSYPIYGPYEPYRYLNWAAKFFADSLMLRQQLASDQERRSPDASAEGPMPGRSGNP